MAAGGNADDATLPVTLTEDSAEASLRAMWPLVFSRFVLASHRGTRPPIVSPTSFIPVPTSFLPSYCSLMRLGAHLLTIAISVCLLPLGTSRCGKRWLMRCTTCTSRMGKVGEPITHWRHGRVDQASCAAQSQPTAFSYPPAVHLSISCNRQLPTTQQVEAPRITPRSSSSWSMAPPWGSSAPWTRSSGCSR